MLRLSQSRTGFRRSMRVPAGAPVVRLEDPGVRLREGEGDERESNCLREGSFDHRGLFGCVHRYWHYRGVYLCGVERSVYLYWVKRSVDSYRVERSVYTYRVERSVYIYWVERSVNLYRVDRSVYAYRPNRSVNTGRLNRSVECCRIGKPYITPESIANLALGLMLSADETYQCFLRSTHNNGSITPL